MHCALGSKPPDCVHCTVRPHALCSQVEPTGMETLRSMARIALFPNRSVVFDQGSVLRNVFIITRGMVRLFRLMPDGRRQITGFLGPGDLLGGIKVKANAHCSAQAISDLVVCGFDRSSFSAFLQANPTLCMTLLVVATDEIEAQYDHAMLLGRKHAAERIAAFLLLLSARWKPIGLNPNVVGLPMPRSDIADHLGLTIETVSRTFAKFKQSGLIEVPDAKTVILSNAPALYDLAGFEELPDSRMAIGM